MSDPAPIQSIGLHHVAFTTRNVEATYDFYANRLGMPLIHTENHLRGDGHFRHFFFGLGNGEALGFFALENVDEDPEYGTAISTDLGLPVWANHIAFKLETVEQLRAKTEELHAKGIDEILEIDHGWCTSIYLNDPNGIMVEYCVTTSLEEFGQTADEAIRRLRLPVDQFERDSRKDDVSVSV